MISYAHLNIRNSDALWNLLMSYIALTFLLSANDVLKVLPVIIFS